MPGIYFAGTIGQGSAGLKKHGLPANSGAVHGARYNARVLAAHLAARADASTRRRDAPAIASSDLVDPDLRRELATGARAVAPAGLPGPGDLARSGRPGRATRGSCRSPPSSTGVGDDGDGRRPRAHARGGRDRRDLPGPLPPPRGPGRGAGDRPRCAPALRHAGGAAPGSRRSSTRPGRPPSADPSRPSRGDAVAPGRLTGDCN